MVREVLACVGSGGGAFPSKVSGNARVSCRRAAQELAIVANWSHYVSRLGFHGYKRSFWERSSLELFGPPQFINLPAFPSGSFTGSSVSFVFGVVTAVAEGCKGPCLFLCVCFVAR